MKKTLITIITALSSLSINAQQIALSSQYMLNDLTLNPASAGLKGHTTLGASFRRQWVGIDQAPVTQTLWGQGNLKYNFAVGGVLFNDATGPTRRTGISPNLAYKVKLNEEYVLSFGVGVSLSQFYLDRDRMRTELPDDIAVDFNSNNRMIPDANAGIILASKNLFVGLSSWHLIQSRKDLFDIEDMVANRLERVYYLTAGYTLQAGKKLEITPSTVFRMMGNAPFTFDFNASAVYDKMYWGGISYRFRDAVALMAGLRFGPMRIGYSYDINISSLSDYNSGTHEIFLGVDITGGKKGNWKRRNRVYSSFSNF
jgi:type IX secretion system PorP/SprF family membrane protein